MVQKAAIYWEEAESAQKATEKTTQTPRSRELQDQGHKTVGRVEHEGQDRSVGE